MSKRVLLSRRGTLLVHRRLARGRFAVIALILVAAFFRVYRLDSQPASLWLDESLTGLNALEIIEGKTVSPWGLTPLDPWLPDWVKTTNLYLYFVVGIFKVFGTGYFGLKAISVLPAIGGVVAGYLLFKALAGRKLAFLAAFLLAVSQWHVTISRWGWDALLMSLLQLVAYWFLIRGIQTSKKQYFGAAGLLIERANSYQPLWESIKNTLLMFNYKGDKNPRHAFPQAAVLEFATSIFFVLGLAYYLRLWKEPHKLFVLF